MHHIRWGHRRGADGLPHASAEPSTIVRSDISAVFVSDHELAAYKCAVAASVKGAIAHPGVSALSFPREPPNALSIGVAH